MTPVVKISANLQLSGRGEGFTRSFDIVIMVPDTNVNALQMITSKEILKASKLENKRQKEHTIIEDGNDKHHKRREVKLPYQCEQHKTKLSQWWENRMRFIGIDLGLSRGGKKTWGTVQIDSV